MWWLCRTQSKQRGGRPDQVHRAGQPAPLEAGDAPTPQRGRLGLGRWHSQGKRRKGQVVLAACLRSQGPLGCESPDPLGSIVNVGGAILSSASSVRVIRSLERIPSSSKWKTRSSYQRIVSAVAVGIGRDALFHRRLRPYQSASPLLAALAVAQRPRAHSDPRRGVSSPADSRVSAGVQEARPSPLPTTPPLVENRMFSGPQKVAHPFLQDRNTA